MASKEIHLADTGKENDLLSALGSTAPGDLDNPGPDEVETDPFQEQVSTASALRRLGFLAWLDLPDQRELCVVLRPGLRGSRVTVHVERQHVLFKWTAPQFDPNAVDEFLNLQRNSDGNGHTSNTTALLSQLQIDSTFETAFAIPSAEPLDPNQRIRRGVVKADLARDDNQSVTYTFYYDKKVDPEAHDAEDSF